MLTVIFLMISIFIILDEGGRFWLKMKKIDRKILLEKRIKSEISKRK